MIYRCKSSFNNLLFSFFKSLKILKQLLSLDCIATTSFTTRSSSSITLRRLCLFRNVGKEPTRSVLLPWSRSSLFSCLLNIFVNQFFLICSLNSFSITLEAIKTDKDSNLFPNSSNCFFLLLLDFKLRTSLSVRLPCVLRQ